MNPVMASRPSDLGYVGQRGAGALMGTDGTELVAQRLSRLHRTWEDAGSNPASPVLPPPEA